MVILKLLNNIMPEELLLLSHKFDNATRFTVRKVGIACVKRVILAPLFAYLHIFKVFIRKYYEVISIANCNSFLSYDDNFIFK